MINIGSMRALRTALLLVIALDLAMVATRVALDPQLLGMPGGPRSAIEPALLLIVGAPLVIRATRGDEASRSVVIREGTTAGLIGGMIEVAHITLENFGHLSAPVESASTGGFLVGLLLVWGIAGYRAARGGAGAGAGAMAGLWSASVGMLIAVTYGFSQLFWGLAGLERRNIGSPDYVRHGWTDLHTFTVADIFESGFKVLLVAPLAGTLVGGLGAVVAWTISAVRNRKRSGAIRSTSGEGSEGS